MLARDKWRYGDQNGKGEAVRKDREEQNKEKTIKECVFSSQHSAAAFTRVLDMEMPAERSEHWRHRLPVDARGELSVKKKEKKKKRYCRERRGRERGSP